MRLFYDDKPARIHLREIARKSGLHGPSVTAALKRLETESILVSEKDGNLKKYSVAPTDRAYLLFEAFDIERFGSLPEIRQQGIKTFLETLPEVPVFAVLFGSSAKGTYRDDSDIDILLVTNRKISTKDAEKEADALTAMRISVFQMEYKDFLVELRMEDDMVVQSAIASGYPLMNHLQYYRKVYDERIRSG